MASRRERNTLRRRDLLARLRVVLVSVCRARLSAEKWSAIFCCSPCRKSRREPDSRFYRKVSHSGKRRQLAPSTLSSSGCEERCRCQSCSAPRKRRALSPSWIGSLLQSQLLPWRDSGKNHDRAKYAVGLCEISRRKEQRSGWTGRATIAKAQSPQPVNSQLQNIGIEQQRREIACRRVERHDCAATELSNQKVSAESAKAGRRSHHHSPGRIQENIVLKAAYQIA